MEYLKDDKLKEAIENRGVLSGYEASSRAGHDNVIRQVRKIPNPYGSDFGSYDIPHNTAERIRREQSKAFEALRKLIVDGE